MQKVIEKMKHSFFNGAAEDHLAAEKPKSVGGWKWMFDEIENVKEGVENISIEEEKKGPA